MAGKKWVSTKFKGVRYYEHPTRKHGVKFDRYFAIRYQKDKKRIEEGIGWASERDPEDDKNWTEAKAALVLERLRGAAKHGKAEAPTRIAEQRELERQRKEAEKLAQEIAEKENITFGQYMTDTYLPQSKLDKKAKSHELESMLYRRHIAETIGALPFGNISAFHMEKIKKTMADKELSGRTIQYALQIIRHVFKKAKDAKIFFGDSPTKAVKWPKPDNMKLRYLSIDEAEKLLAALARKSQTLHDAALLSLHCGLRFGEIAALTWSCWNREAGSLSILNAKTGSRTAYLTDQTKAMLKERTQGRPDELIFQKRSVRDAAKSNNMIQASKVFSDTVKELGFNDGVTDRKQKVTFHTLRHTYATHLYESTHDLYLTQRSLGHATGTMTARYAKMSENRLREGAAALQKTFTVNGTKQAGQVVDFKK